MDFVPKNPGQVSKKPSKLSKDLTKLIDFSKFQTCCSIRCAGKSQKTKTVFGADPAWVIPTDVPLKIPLSVHQVQDHYLDLAIFVDDSSEPPAGYTFPEPLGRLRIKLGDFIHERSILYSYSENPDIPSDYSLCVGTWNIKFQYQSQMILFSLPYANLEKQITTYRFHIMRVLVRLCKNTDVYTVNAILATFYDNGVLVQFLEEIISDYFWNFEEEPETGYFREDTIYSSLIENFLLKICEPYLITTLTPFLQSILEEKSLSQSFSLEDLKPEQEKILEEYSQQLVKLILSSADNFPMEGKRIFKAIRKQLTVHRKTEVINKVVGSFYFLRLVSPCLISPVKFKALFTIEPEHVGHVKECLLYCAKFVQRLSFFDNRSEGGVGERDISKFLDSISLIDQSNFFEQELTDYTLDPYAVHMTDGPLSPTTTKKTPGSIKSLPKRPKSASTTNSGRRLSNSKAKALPTRPDEIKKVGAEKSVETCEAESSKSGDNEKSGEKSSNEKFHENSGNETDPDIVKSTFSEKESDFDSVESDSDRGRRKEKDDEKSSPKEFSRSSSLDNNNVTQVEPLSSKLKDRSLSRGRRAATGRSHSHIDQTEEQRRERYGNNFRFKLRGLALRSIINNSSDFIHFYCVATQSWKCIPNLELINNRNLSSRLSVRILGPPIPKKDFAVTHSLFDQDGRLKWDDHGINNSTNSVEFGSHTGSSGLSKEEQNLNNSHEISRETENINNISQDHCEENKNKLSAKKVLNREKRSDSNADKADFVMEDKISDDAIRSDLSERFKGVPDIKLDLQDCKLSQIEVTKGFQLSYIKRLLDIYFTDIFNALNSNINTVQLAEIFKILMEVINGIESKCRESLKEHFHQADKKSGSKKKLDFTQIHSTTSPVVSTPTQTYVPISFTTSSSSSSIQQQQTSPPRSMQSTEQQQQQQQQEALLRPSILTGSQSVIEDQKSPRSPTSPRGKAPKSPMKIRDKKNGQLADLSASGPK